MAAGEAAVPDTLAQPLERFLYRLAHVRRLSPRTVDGYARDLRDFAAWAAERGLVDWDALRMDGVRAYLAARHQAGLSHTCGQRLQQMALAAARGAPQIRRCPRHLQATQVGQHRDVVAGQEVVEGRCGTATERQRQLDRGGSHGQCRAAGGDCRQRTSCRRNAGASSALGWACR